MSSPRYRWWGFARRMIRDYRSLKIQYEDLHSQSITAGTSGMPRGSGNRSVVESLALRQLPKDDQRVYDAVSRAVEITNLLPDGELKLDLIRYVYWNKRQHTVKDAAMQLYISRRTAERWHAEFVRLVGKCYGFEVGGSEPKNRGIIVESE